MLQTGSVDLQRLFGHPSDNSTKSSRLIFHSVTIKPTQPSHNGIPANVSHSSASPQRAQVGIFIVLIPTGVQSNARPVEAPMASPLASQMSTRVVSVVRRIEGSKRKVVSDSGTDLCWIGPL